MVVPALSTADVPSDGARNVHVGANAEVNFVNAVSMTFPVFTYPVRARELSAAIHERSALGAELRTTDATAPVFETFIRTPSRRPANFLPPRVSELDPKTETEPSPSRTIALRVVFAVPIKVGFPKIPSELDS